MAFRCLQSEITHYLLTFLAVLIRCFIQKLRERVRSVKGYARVKGPPVPLKTLI